MTAEMGGLLKSFSSQFVRGLKDAVLGIWGLYDIDNKLALANEESKKSKTAKPERMSKMAQEREAKKAKYKDKIHDNRPKVRQRIFMCCAWNGGIFGMSLFLFNSAILPCVQYLTLLISGDVLSYLVVSLTWVFHALWVLPLFILSKVVNSLWFQDIADAAYRKSQGRPLMLPSLSKIIADVLFSILLQSLFLIQGMLTTLLPLPGLCDVISYFHMCLLYSMYAFEYKWFNMGWEVHKRLHHIENNWPYFTGFGLPLVLLTYLSSSSLVSGCIFSILFPLFIISANEAEHIHGSYEYPLHIFGPVVAISNTIFHHSVKVKPVTSSPKKYPSSMKS